MNRRIFLALLALCLTIIVLTPTGRPGAAASASSFFFTTGEPDGRMAAASRPESRHKIEIEAADDFILTSQTIIDRATFTGLLFHGGHGEIRDVTVEIYRVFPLDSNTGRTPKVPTRMNSPSDDALTERSSADGTLRFTATVVNPHFEAANSVIDGIHPSPDQVTGGEGPVAGQEVLFEVFFDPPIDLPANHYFFVPQVELEGRAGNFLWLSAPGPPLFTGDLQMWIRNADLEPDWLRVGGDIVGPTPASGPKFNGSFSLTGATP
ncbi:MAG TPA: hypothetical protein VGP85_15900 [Pyrinomonadaceae bacterium]|jgi:hypothetical protein|nr:hypothetical protein [Pyrinomonadaceae bacterium]